MFSFITWCRALQLLPSRPDDVTTGREVSTFELKKKKIIQQEYENGYRPTSEDD